MSQDEQQVHRSPQTHQTHILSKTGLLPQRPLFILKDQ